MKVPTSWHDHHLRPPPPRQRPSRIDGSSERASADVETKTTAGNQYLTGLTLYFIGYVLFEVSFCPRWREWVGWLAAV